MAEYLSAMYMAVWLSLTTESQPVMDSHTFLK